MPTLQEFFTTVRLNQQRTSVEEDAPRKMTCRTPSSASSHSASSHSSASSTFSSLSTGSTASTSEEWQQTISLREIYKSGKLKLIPSEKRIFSRPREKTYYCLFCIHDESIPFLELYDDHKSSLSHEPVRVIALGHCQHVSPNINPNQHFHSFTLTLASENYHLAADNHTDMQDWIVTLRTKLHELQSFQGDKNAYTRCPLVPKSDPSPPSPVDSPSETTHILLPQSTSLSPTLLRSDRSRTSGRLRDQPIKKPPALRLPIQPLDPALSSPPAFTAPPIPDKSASLPASPTMPPPIPPRGVKLMRPVPHPLLSAHIPPPPPPRIGEERKEEGQGVMPLISLDEEGEGKKEYGALFKRPEKLEGTWRERKRSPAGESGHFRRATRSQTASPALSERSVASTLSEPSPTSALAPFSAFWSCDSDKNEDKNSANRPEKVLTLRQQQVVKLKEQMHDPRGVKVKLRKKDCLASLALVDAFGCVWVAGWKQREHPHFHSVFHLGDQVVSVNGIYIARAADAYRLVQDAPPNRSVVFNLQRVPRARVFVIERQMDGENLGLMRDGKSAEIKSVVPDQPAAKFGMPAKAITCDGTSLCNWVLTEINHRPLNWFFKDNEIDDRLNALGKEISVLVQPSDLVQAIKKQLKTLRNYKDYIVQ